MLVAGEDMDEKYKHIHMLKWQQKGRDSRLQRCRKQWKVALELSAISSEEENKGKNICHEFLG